jgi:hypothetical protein
VITAHGAWRELAMGVSCNMPAAQSEQACFSFHNYHVHSTVLLNQYFVLCCMLDAPE